MEYLHSSAIISHGRLKSSNCLVDGRWMLMVADWGLSHFRNKPEMTDAQYQGNCFCFSFCQPKKNHQHNLYKKHCKLEIGDANIS